MTGATSSDRSKHVLNFRGIELLTGQGPHAAGSEGSQ